MDLLTYWLSFTHIQIAVVKIPDYFTQDEYRHLNVTFNISRLKPSKNPIHLFMHNMNKLQSHVLKENCKH